MHTIHTAISVRECFPSKTFPRLASAPTQYSTISQSAEYPLWVLKAPANTSTPENNAISSTNARLAVLSSTANINRFKTGIAKNNAKNAVKYQKTPKVTGKAALIRSFTVQSGFRPAIVNRAVTTNE